MVLGQIREAKDVGITLHPEILERYENPRFELPLRDLNLGFALARGVIHHRLKKLPRIKVNEVQLRSQKVRLRPLAAPGGTIENDRGLFHKLEFILA